MGGSAHRKRSFCFINRLGLVTSTLLGVLAHSRYFKKSTQRTAKCALFSLGSKYVSQVHVARHMEIVLTWLHLLSLLCVAKWYEVWKALEVKGPSEAWGD